RRSEPAPGARHPRWAPSWARAVLAGLLLTVAGCLPGMRRSHPLPPATATGLLEELAARRAAVQSLRARVRLRAGLAGMWVREVLLVRRPSSVRIDVLSPFGLALAVGTDGGLLWAYPAGQGTRYEGAATPANLARFLGTPATVADVVDVLLGTAPRRVPARDSRPHRTGSGVVAARGPRPPHLLRARVGRRPRGRRCIVRARSWPGARAGRRIGLRQDDDRAVAHAPRPAPGTDRRRTGVARGTRSPRASGTRDACGPRRGHGDDLPGAHDLAEPGVHRRQPDRR